MSSQGSVQSVAYEIERSMLESWGAWSRSGDLGLGYGSGYAPVELITRSGVGIMYSDEVMLMTDGIICGLSPYHKQIIKRYYLHKEWAGISDRDVKAAIAAFSDALCDGELIA